MTSQLIQSGGFSIPSDIALDEIKPVHGKIEFIPVLILQEKVVVRDPPDLQMPQPSVMTHSVVDMDDEIVFSKFAVRRDAWTSSLPRSGGDGSPDPSFRKPPALAKNFLFRQNHPALPRVLKS